MLNGPDDGGPAHAPDLMRLSDIGALALVGLARLFGPGPVSCIVARLLPPDNASEG